MNKKFIKTVKFGGSSLADANQFKKVASIVLAEKERKYVIPSAPGKRFKEDTKVTDLLLKAYALSSEDKDLSETFNTIKERYNSIISELSLKVSLDSDFEEIEANLKKGTTKDYVASRGEYLNGKLLADYLGFEFIDAADIIVFNEDGSFNADETNVIAKKTLASKGYCVIPGFYGATKNGEVKTFSRGGSDITGAIISRAVMADIYENWTDVSGFLKADPRIVDDPKSIKYITYQELRELSYMGATVLHEDSIFPVKIAGIPINIKNTNHPEDIGTMIVAASYKTTEFMGDEIITGIAGKEGFCAINIEKDMMNQEVGFGKKVLDVLYDMNISFEHLPSGIDTMSVIVNSTCIEGREKEIMDKLMKAVTPDSLEIESGIALIAVVGRGMIKNIGTSGRVFTALSNAGINIRMIDQGSCELNIIIGVDEHDFKKAIKVIYDEFLG